MEESEQRTISFWSLIYWTRKQSLKQGSRSVFKKCQEGRRSAMMKHCWDSSRRSNVSWRCRVEILSAMTKNMVNDVGDVEVSVQVCCLFLQHTCTEL